MWLCRRNWPSSSMPSMRGILMSSTAMIDGLRAQPLQRLGAVAVAAHGKAFRLERHRYRSQNVPVVIHQSNRVRHLVSP